MSNISNERLRIENSIYQVNGANIVLLTLAGAFDFNQSGRFRKAYQSYPIGADFILDLSQVTQLGTTAYNAFKELVTWQIRHKQSLTVVLPEDPFVASLLKASACIEIMAEATSATTALQSLGVDLKPDDVNEI